METTFNDDDGDDDDRETFLVLQFPNVLEDHFPILKKIRRLKCENEYNKETE